MDCQPAMEAIGLGVFQRETLYSFGMTQLWPNGIHGQSRFTS
jgi:hypothetical protein